MKNYNWFWVTLGGWFFTFSISSWALIYSPFRLDSKTLLTFSTEVNGTKTQNQLSLVSGSADFILKELTQEWQGRGWTDMTGKVNLACALLQLPRQYQAYLDPFIQIRVFQNPKAFRVLGVWLDVKNDQTYQWVSDWPREVFQPQDPSKVDFPLKPPPGAFDIFTLKTEKASSSFWSLKSAGDIAPVFSRIFTSQGFNGKRLVAQSGETSFFLQKGRNQLLGIVRLEGQKMDVSVMQLNGN